MLNDNLFKKTRKQKEASRASGVATITTWSEVCQKQFFLYIRAGFLVNLNICCSKKNYAIILICA